MKIEHSSELMTNQKHAVAMAPQARFRLAQTRQSHELIFSIGTDNIFYRTKEEPGSRAGWDLLDESSGLSERFAGQPVAAKLFDVSSNLSDGQLDLALAVTVEGVDHLLLALDHPNNDEDWSAPIDWVDIPFDAPPGGQPRLSITGIYLAQHGGESAIVVDILKDPEDPLQIIERYFIDPSGTISGRRWNLHDLAVSLTAGSVSSVLGRKSGQMVDGIYTLGTLASTKELIYSQIRNPFGGNPLVSRFPLPPGSDGAEAAFALGANADGTTDLYIAAAGGLYYLAANEQRDLTKPELIVWHPLLRNVTALTADVNGREIVVWGLNELGQVFCLRNTVGQQKSAGAWSVPVPVLEDTLGVSTLINKHFGGSVILAHCSDGRLVQLTEDPTTSLWAQREIVLPATAVSDVLTVTTYTTHIQISSDSNLPLSNEDVDLWASSPCQVYVNSSYHRLFVDTPVRVRTDANGTLTIIQQVDSIGVASYTLEAGGGSMTIDPMGRARDKLAKVQSGPDLDITIYNDRGEPRPLVKPDIPAGRKDDTARGISQFLEVAKTLPPDGSARSAARRFRALQGERRAGQISIFGARFTPEGGTFFEGWDGAAKAGFSLRDGALSISRPGREVEDVGEAIAVAAGDLFRWIRNAIDDVEEFFVTFEQNVATFFIRIAGTLYQIFINCLQDVANGINFLLEKIEVALHDLVAWLGFLFEWPDIVRTHRVLKTLFRCLVRHSFDQLATLRGEVTSAFRAIEKEIGAWAHLTPIPSSANSVAAAAGELPGRNDPQFNWSSYHLKDNAANGETSWQQSVPQSSVLEKLLQELKATLEREEDVFRHAIEQLQTDVIDQLRSLPVTDILQRVVAIVLDALLETIENVIVTGIDIFAILVEGVLAMLEAPIEIPIISQAYRQATGEPLTILDAACLVAAIPVTLLYKVMDGEAPYPDDDFTRSLIAAQNLQQIRELFNGTGRALALRHADYRHLEQVCAICAIPASAVLCFVTPFRDALPNNWALAVVGTITYVFYCAPNLPAIIEDDRSKWYNGLDLGITCFSIAKAMGDVSLCAYKEKGENGLALELLKKFSPWIEFGVNAAWFAPVIGSIIAEHEEKDVLNCIGNCGFNISGMAALPMSFDDPKAKAAGLVAFIAGDVVYGYMNLLVAGLLAQAAPSAPRLAAG
ncbi:hypothetical protein HMPREF9946_02508 [Acetobacteraceae bacterium AT-5844]|nr:hypothetical protein HMPREF9946_02508 [Acetobacteraceae bacterium AT-5844]